MERIIAAVLRDGGGRHVGLAAGRVDRVELVHAGMAATGQRDLAERAPARGDDQVGPGVAHAPAGVVVVAEADPDALVGRGGVAHLGAQQQRTAAPRGGRQERKVVHDEPARRVRGGGGDEREEAQGEYSFHDGWGDGGYSSRKPGGEL